MKQLSWPLSLSAVGLLCLSASQAAAEQYMDTFYYKSSHNSYERGWHPAGPPALPYTGVRIPLWEHPLKFNCYFLELDMCKNSTTGKIVVKHTCDILVAELDGATMRDELLSKPEIFERFTIIHMEPWGGTCCNGGSDAWSQGNWDSSDDTELQNFWTAAIPTSQVYTYNEFVADGSVWPTIPELIGRGKHFAFEHGRGLGGGGFFFRGSLGAAATGTQFLGREDGQQDSGDNIVAGDAYLYRGYPNRYWDDGLISGPILWNDYLVNDMNELATNEIGWFYTAGNGTYPPYPMYIESGFVAGDWGTPYLPFPTITAGIARIEATVPVPEDRMLMKITPANYTLQGTPARITTHTRWERDGTSGVVRVTRVP